jgi:putative flavoprotein involved in K+ transport
VVVGAGHAGLAISHALSERSLDHVVLERGEVANSWRTERWDSLRLLTPNWQSGLPGYSYRGEEPHGFMTMREVIEHIAGYAAAISAPVRTHTTVTSVTGSDGGYRVITNQGEIACRTLVIASGAANVAQVPSVSQAVPHSIECVTAFQYRGAQQLPGGGVLVVGASATGIQLAEEIQRSGREVILCVGEHIRLPRTYRGKDVLWWMENAGVWSERYDEIEDLERARRLPSPQLIGSPARATLNVGTLHSAGVEIVGRLAMVRDGQALFSGGLANQLALADLKLGRLLDTFDEWAQRSPHGAEFEPPERFDPISVPVPRLSLDLRSGEIRSIVWATGFRPDHAWLKLPVFDRKGQLRHDGGVVVSAPGVYAMGLPVLRRRKSTFITGAAEDANDVVAHLAQCLGCRGKISPGGNA